MPKNVRTLSGPAPGLASQGHLLLVHDHQEFNSNFPVGAAGVDGGAVATFLKRCRRSPPETYLWLAGNEGVEKNMATTLIVG